MANTQISIVQLKYMIDHAASEDVKAQLVAIQKDILGTGSAAKIASSQTVAAIQQQSQAYNNLDTTIKQTAADADRLSKIKPGDFLRSLSGEGGGGASSGDLGGTRRFLGAAGGLVNQVAPGAGQAFGLAGDVTELVKDLPKFKDVLAGLNPELVAGGVAAAGFTAALAVLHQQFEAGKQSALNELDARQKAFTEFQTMTTAEIQARVKELQTEKQLRENAAQDAQAILNQTIADTQKAYGDLGLGIAAINATLGTGAPELAAAKQHVESANKALDTTSTELDILTEGLNANWKGQKDVEEATKAATEAEARLAAERAKTDQTSLDSQVQLHQKIRDLYIGGGQQDLDKLKKSTQDQINANLDKIDAEYKLQATYQKGSEAYNQITAIIRHLNDSNTDLATSMAQLGDANLATAVKTNDAIKYQAQQQKDIAASVQKYNDDVAKINEQAQAAQLAALDKYNESLVKAAENAAHAAEEALQKLQERRADLATSLARNEADAQAKYQFDQLNTQIKFQEEEAKSARDHARDLQKIREDAQAEEFDLILNRDFAGLFKSRQDTQRRLTDAERQYQDERRDRQTAYQQQNADAARQYAFDAQQRQIHYQQDLNDAALQYQRERQQIEQNRERAQAEAKAARDRDLQLARQKEAEAFNIRRTAAIAELQLINQTEQQRLQIVANTQATLIQQAQSMLALVSGGGGTPVVAGPVGGGVLAGSATSRNAAFNFNISGNNPLNIGQAVERHVHRAIQDIFG